MTLGGCWQRACCGCWCAGHGAIEYFNGLPLKAHGMQPGEPLREGNNEAEWIVDLTTRADREGRRASACQPGLHP